MLVRGERGTQPSMVTDASQGEFLSPAVASFFVEFGKKSRRFDAPFTILFFPSSLFHSLSVSLSVILVVCPVPGVVHASSERFSSRAAASHSCP